jgi:CMP-N,N'-diacetyllegionaminic acid synthase
VIKRIAFIPARSGSKRIKNKNIINFNGKPLLAHTILAAKKSKIFNRIVVVTDSKKYQTIAKKFGAEVPFLRPKKISLDISPDIEWVKFAIKKLKLNQDEIFFILRPTSPFRTSKTIKRAWNLFNKNKKKIDSVRAVEICKQHPGKMWISKGSFIKPLVNKKINGTPYHSNQFKILPTIYVQNASLEISFVKNVIKKNSISGKKIMPFFTKNLEGIDINYQEDLNFIKKFKKNS